MARSYINKVHFSKISNLFALIVDYSTAMNLQVNLLPELCIEFQDESFDTHIAMI